MEGRKRGEEAGRFKKLNWENLWLTSSLQKSHFYPRRKTGLNHPRKDRRKKGHFLPINGGRGIFLSTSPKQNVNISAINTAMMLPLNAPRIRYLSSWLDWACMTRCCGPAFYNRSKKPHNKQRGQKHRLALQSLHSVDPHNNKMHQTSYNPVAFAELIYFLLFPLSLAASPSLFWTKGFEQLRVSWLYANNHSHV